MSSCPTLFEGLSEERRVRLTKRMNGLRIVLPEGEDERVRVAASWLEGGLGARVILGSQSYARQKRDRVKEILAESFRRRGKDLPPDLEERSEDVLLAAGADLLDGHCDLVVAGACHETSAVLRAILSTVGLAPEVKTLTSAFLMQLREATPGGENPILFADAGVVPKPSSEQLVDIAHLSASAFASWCGREARLAFLSFSTKGSATHPDVSRVRDAFVSFQSRFPKIPAAGEVQFDAAVVPAVALRKDPEASPEFAGKANVFIFPDLNSGNICYKAVERLAGARAWGPIVLGAAKPYADLSRGCSALDICHVACLAASVS